MSCLNNKQDIFLCPILSKLRKVVNSLNEIVTIENTEMQIREYNGQRVVTFKDIDLVHQNKSGTSKRNFTRNKKHFVENEDFILITREKLKGDNLSLLNIEVPTRGITVLTESGYLLIAKSFTDDLSWQVQRTLVNNYFKNKEQTVKENAIEPVFNDTKNVLKCDKYPEIPAEEVVAWKLNNLHKRVIALEKEQVYNSQNVKTHMLIPKKDTWYEKNRNLIWQIHYNKDIEIKELYHIILDECNKYYNLEEAKKIYQIETGQSLVYGIGLVEYFPQLQAIADQVLDCYKL